MSHGWKMWINIGWAEGELFSSLHLSEKGALKASIEDMLELIMGGVELPEGFRDPGDLSVYDRDTLNDIWIEMERHFHHTPYDFDIQHTLVRR